MNDVTQEQYMTQHTHDIHCGLRDPEVEIKAGSDYAVPAALETQRGALTFMETMGVLIVGAIVLAAAAAGLYALFSAQSQSDELNFVSTIITNVRDLRTTSGYGTAGSDLMPNMVAIGGIPKSMGIVGGVPVNSYNQQVTLVVDGTGNGWVLTDPGLPKEDCNRIAKKMSVAKSVNTTSINGGAAITGEISPSVAAAQCTGTSNSIAWAGL
ncbi:type IV B pilus protein [Burkholderia pseudomallei]|nr:type IV B pilus protein [Burkholderia pseudomallei]